MINGLKEGECRNWNQEMAKNDQANPLNVYPPDIKNNLYADIVSFSMGKMQQTVNMFLQVDSKVGHCLSRDAFYFAREGEGVEGLYLGAGERVECGKF